MKEAETTTLWLVRHGKTMFNTSKRVQGWSDTPLTVAGKQEIGCLREGLNAIDFVGAYSSDSGRARETLQILLEHREDLLHTYQQDWRLREANFGFYEGEYEDIMYRAVAKHQEKSLEQWLAETTPLTVLDEIAHTANKHLQEDQIWSADTFATLSMRLWQAIETIVRNHAEGGNILIVTHGGSIATLLASLNPEDPKQAKGIKNGSITQISYHKQEGYRIKNINDISYLERAKSHS